jgi:hypothetical protein
MRTKVHFLSFDEVLSTLRTLGFDVQPVPEVANQFLVGKYGAGAILAHAAEPTGAEKKVPQVAVRWRERPGYLLGGEVATLLDRGYQKFWKSSRIEVPATADSLKSCGRSSASLACTTSPWAQPAIVTCTTASKAAICRWRNGQYRRGNSLPRPSWREKRKTPISPLPRFSRKTFMRRRVS